MSDPIEEARALAVECSNTVVKLRAALAEKDRRIAELEAAITSVLAPIEVSPGVKRRCLTVEAEDLLGHAFGQLAGSPLEEAIRKEAAAFHRDVLDVLTSVQNLTQAYDEISGWDPMRRREG